MSQVQGCLCFALLLLLFLRQLKASKLTHNSRLWWYSKLTFLKKKEKKNKWLTRCNLNAYFHRAKQKERERRKKMKLIKSWWENVSWRKIKHIFLFFSSVLSIFLHSVPKFINNSFRKLEKKERIVSCSNRALHERKHTVSVLWG